MKLANFSVDLIGQMSQAKDNVGASNCVAFLAQNRLAGHLSENQYMTMVEQYNSGRVP